MRQIRALSRVRISMYADLKATLYNCHTVTDGVPWEAADFMGGGNRAQRKAEKQRSDYAVAKVNAKLASMRPGVRGPDVPEWA